MEVHAIDTLSGREEPLEIDPDATVSTLKRRCGRAFGFGEDVELSVGGQRVACDGAECVSSVAAFSGGCQVGVVRGVAQFVAQLSRGAVKMDDIPVWAQQRRECVLAVLARALEGTQGGDDEDDDEDEEEEDIVILPHWVHPSLHDDKEVMLQFVRCDPNAFLRASPELRSDADVVIAALEQNASMWQHVVDKSLQEQRSVALVAVPYCANSAVWLSDKAFVLEALESNTALKLADVNETLQEDKEVVMTVFDYVDVNFGTLSEELRGDKEVAMRFLRSGKLDDFHHLSATLQEDKEVVRKALARRRVRFDDLSEALRGDRELALRALDCGGLHDFCQLSATLQQDSKVALKAVHREIVKFGALSEALRGDKELAMQVLSHGYLTDFRELSTTLQEDKEVVMRAFHEKIVKYSDLSEALQGDKVLAMEALTCGYLRDFHQLSTTLQEDNEVVMEALCMKVVKFGDLSEALQADKDVVMQALSSGYLKDFHRLNATLQEDMEVATEALRKKIVTFGDLSEALRGQREFVLRALSRGALEHFYQLNTTLQQDREVAMKAFAESRVEFGDLSESLRADKSFVLQALTFDIETYTDICNPLRQDKDVVLAAIAESSSAFVSMDTALRDDLDVALAAIRADPCNFVYAGDSVRADRRAALAAFCVDEARLGDPPVLLPFASAELQADREVVLAAVRANPQNAAHASPALQDLVASVL